MAELEPITIRATIAAGPDVVWTYLTEPERVAEWFTEASPIGGVDAPYVLDFGDGSGIEGRVRALEPERVLSYTWRWHDAPAEEETLVTWELEPARGGRTILNLTHGGWSAAGLDASARDDHRTYWRGYVGALVDLLAGDA